MKSDKLLEILRRKAQQEQNLTLEVIELIREVNQRKIYLKIGYASLFDFVTKDLGYEPSSAMRRIQAARLVQEIPEVKEKINNKELSLSVVSQAQSFFKKQEKEARKKISVTQKIEVLKNLEGKSYREAQKELVKICPESIKKVEKLREISDQWTELKIILGKESIEKLDELKTFLSHQNPDLSYQGIVELLIEKIHRVEKKKRDAQSPSRKINRETSQKKWIKNERSHDRGMNQKSEVDEGTKVSQLLPTSVVKNHRKAISKSTVRAIWQRDQGKCQFRDQRTGRQCSSAHFLEIDHIDRIRNGGSNDISNLRLLCRAHNQWRG